MTQPHIIHEFKAQADGYREYALIFKDQAGGAFCAISKYFDESERCKSQSVWKRGKGRRR